MPGSNAVVNVVVAGLGGQGVLKASGILADAAFRAGLDVKKSEIHGMSQRGGSVSSVLSDWPILPISLLAPIAVTSAVPVPRTTSEPEKT